MKFFSQWADVVVLARELSLDQIGRIARAIDAVTGVLFAGFGIGLVVSVLRNEA